MESGILGFGIRNVAQGIRNPSSALTYINITQMQQITENIGLWPVR